MVHTDVLSEVTVTTDRLSPRCRVSRPLRAILPVLLASLALLLLLSGIASAAPTDQPQTIAFNQAVAAIIAQVTTPTLEYELAGLTGERPVTVAGSLYTITTRNTYYTDQISMATRYAYEQFAGLGLAVTYHHYTWMDRYGRAHDRRNVAAEKRGLVDPDEIYLITAHVDDLPEGPLAPGADDNGSGSVAVLTAARLLAPRHFAHTIRFVLFTGEEQGLHGSAAYAADCKARGENIQGVVNLDMIAYNSDGAPVIDLYAGTDVIDSLELTRIFSEVVGAYSLNLVPDCFSGGWPTYASDQWSFLQQGYPALLAIEDLDDSSSHWHTAGDRLATLDLDYYGDFTRAAVATIAHLGRLLPAGRLSGTVYALDTGQPLSASVGAFAPTYHHTFTTMADASGQVSLVLPVGVYTLTAWPASPGYYPATITDVLIVTDTANVQNVALVPWLRLYLPWIVHGHQHEH
jgi:hypothetical protein